MDGRDGQLTESRQRRCGDQTRRDLRCISADGVAFSVMVGVGETYVPAFALAAGMGEAVAGWLVSLPLLGGAIIQMISPAAIARLGRLRIWVIGCAVVQAISMLAYCAFALSAPASTSLLFLIAIVYWASGLATGPAWNTWVGALVPRRIRPRFFARRSRYAQLALLLGVVGAGLALHVGRDSPRLLHVFAGLFAVAAVARFFSSLFLASQREPAGATRNHRMVTIRAWISRWRGSNDGRLLIYMLGIQCALQVSGPFFTPYMLGELQFDYLAYLTLIGCSYLTKMLVLRFIGEVVQRIGPRRVLIAAGIGIVPMSALWIISDSFAFLLCVQVLAGIVWAAYELTTFLLLFDHIDEAERTSVLTTYNLAHAVMTVCGALIGGLILKALNEEHIGYVAVFALSGVIRLLMIPLLLRIGRIPVEHFDIAVRPLAVRPNSGSLDAPIVSSIKDDA